MLAAMAARTLEPYDPDVVAPWKLGNGRRGVLLLHGFAGTPPELRYLGDFLAAHGWRCAAPALAGHATTPEDLAATGWRDWVASAQDALDELFAECDQVCVAGQSMGASIALYLAATDTRIAAVATLAAPIWIGGWREKLLRYMRPVYRWHYPKSDTDLYWKHAVEELHSYGKRSTGAIVQLFDLLGEVANRLALVRAPVLVLHGDGDRVVHPGNADAIAQRLVCAADVEVRRFTRSGHAMSVDVDRDEINAAVLEWFDRFAPAKPSQSLAPTPNLASVRDIRSR